MIGAAIRKDARLLLRDRGALISLFALPLVFIVAFGSMFRFGDERGAPRPIALWRAPGDERGEAIARAIDATPGFATRAQPSPEAVRAEVAGEREVAGVIVPADGPIELVIDQGAPEQARGPIQGALGAAVMRALAPAPLERFIVVRTPPGIAPPIAQPSSFQVAVPGNAVLFGFFIALTTAMAFLAERRSGAWRRLLAAPVPRWKALLATLVPYALVGAIQQACLFTVGHLAFGMQVAGSLVALVALAAATTLCAVSLGLVFAAIARTEKQLGGIGSVMLLVMGLIGGCMMPRLVMPPTMQRLGLAVPHGWALDGYQAVLVRAGTTVADIAPQLGALVAFAVGFAALGLWRFDFEA